MAFRSFQTVCASIVHHLSQHTAVALEGSGTIWGAANGLGRDYP